MNYLIISKKQFKLCVIYLCIYVYIDSLVHKYYVSKIRDFEITEVEYLTFHLLHKDGNISNFSFCFSLLFRDASTYTYTYIDNLVHKYYMSKIRDFEITEVEYLTFHLLLKDAIFPTSYFFHCYLETLQRIRIRISTT